MAIYSDNSVNRFVNLSEYAQTKEYRQLKNKLEATSERVAELERVNAELHKALKDMLMLIGEHGSQHMKAHATRISKAFGAFQLPTTGGAE